MATFTSSAMNLFRAIRAHGRAISNTTRNTQHKRGTLLVQVLRAACSNGGYAQVWPRGDRLTIEVGKGVSVQTCNWECAAAAQHMLRTIRWDCCNSRTCVEALSLPTIVPDSELDGVTLTQIAPLLKRIGVPLTLPTYVFSPRSPDQESSS